MLTNYMNKKRSLGHREKHTERERGLTNGFAVVLAAFPTGCSTGTPWAPALLLACATSAF
jgi:hypothetical protein